MFPKSLYTSQKLSWNEDSVSQYLYKMFSVWCSVNASFIMIEERRQWVKREKIDNIKQFGSLKNWWDQKYIKVILISVF